MINRQFIFSLSLTGTSVVSSYFVSRKMTMMNNTSVSFVLLSLSVIAVLSTSVKGEKVCPSGWERRLDTCYKVHGYNLTFFEARIVCQDFYDASLLTIKSPEEQLYIMSLVFHHWNVKRDVWLGLRRVNDTYFKWIDGSPVNYTNWGPTEPSDTTTFCVAINQQPVNIGKWYDRGCRELYPPVCQRQATDGSQPAVEESSTSFQKTMGHHFERHNFMMICLIGITAVILLLVFSLFTYVGCISNKPNYPLVMTYKNGFTNNLSNNEA